VLYPTRPLLISVTQRARQVIRPVDIPAAGVAALLAAFVVGGASFQSSNSAGWFSSSVGAFAGSVLAVVAVATALYFPISLGYAWLDRRRAKARADTPRVLPMRRALAQWFWPTFGFLMAGWLTWLLIHYPGIIHDTDTTSQLLQWYGILPKVNHHPWFDTIVFGQFWDLGRALGSDNAGLLIYLLFQVTGIALGMSLVLAYLGRLGLPAGPRRVLTAFAALCPAFLIAVSEMTKDNFAGMFWLPFLVLFVEAVRTRGRILCRPWIASSAIALAIPLVLTKRTSLYLFLLCVLVVLLTSVPWARWRLLVGAAMILVLTTLVWPLIVLPSLGVRPATATDTLSIPLQQTARTVARHGPDIPQDERAAIAAVLPYDRLAEIYDPRTADRVKAKWNEQASASEKAAYLGVWLEQSARYPGTYFAALANNTFPYFIPGWVVNYPRELEQSTKIDYLLTQSVEGTTRADIERAVAGFRPPPVLDELRLAVNRVTAVGMKGNLLTSMAFYCSWLPVLVLGFALRNRNWLLGLATVPFFIYLLILVAGPVAGMRYMVPMVLGSVLLAGLTMVPRTWQAAERRRPISGGPEPTA
jgi:Family of unknown function (DUF6020)